MPNPTKSILARHFGTAMLLLCAACSQSPPPKVTELIKVGVPTLGGARYRSYTSPTITYNLTGECDVTSRTLQYSTDNATWIDFAASCPTGSFTLPVNITTGSITIYVRAWGKFTATDSSQADIRFTPPSSSPLLNMVVSSRSDRSDLVGPGTQNVMSDFSTGAPSTSVSNRLYLHTPGIVYSE